MSQPTSLSDANPGTVVNPTVSRARPLSLVRMQWLVDVPSRWTLFALGLWVLYQTRDAGVQGPWRALFGIYGLVAVAATILWYVESRRARAQTGSKGEFRLALVTYTLYMIDALFVSALIWLDGGLGSPLYILLVLLAVKAVSLAPVLPRMVWLPFTFGPLYAAALWLASGSMGFLADPSFQSRYVLLWAWLIGVALIGFDLSRRTKQTVALEGALARQQGALALQTEVLQRTATDLGDRLLELRALQEVAKALATTLRTEETLKLVVEQLASATGSSHCAVALIESAHREGADEDRGLEDGVLAGALVERRTRRAVCLPGGPVRRTRHARGQRRCEPAERGEQPAGPGRVRPRRPPWLTVGRLPVLMSRPLYRAAARSVRSTSRSTARPQAGPMRLR